MVKKPVVRKLLKYKTLLEKNGIPVAHLILFGSHATGSPRPDSDIDVCVISPKLGKNRANEGKELILLALQIDPLIEPVAFSNKEYLTNRISPLLDQIRNNGIKIC